jgi:hypothetical protein
VAQRPDGTWVEIGITSFGPADGNTADADFFTRADSISAWVNSEIPLLSPPAVTSGAASQVGQSTAQLNGQVNPNENATTYFFQYGTSTGYGETTPSRTTNNGSTALSADASLSGLAPGSTYHYRLIATNANGTSYGADQAFTTSAPPPPPPSPEPEYGQYKGRTSQGWPIHVRVGTNATSIASVSFSFTLRCTRHRRPLSYNIVAGNTPWELDRDDGLGFSNSFRDTTGTHYGGRHLHDQRSRKRNPHRRLDDPQAWNLRHQDRALDRPLTETPQLANTITRGPRARSC